MAAIQKRLIIDTVVRDAGLARGFDDRALRLEYPGYVDNNNVKETLNTVGLDEIDLLSSFKNTYNSMKIDTKACSFVFRGQVIPISDKVLKFLKALAIEQISFSAEYCEIVSSMFMSAVKHVVSKTPLMPSEDAMFYRSKLEYEMVKAFNEFYETHVV